MHPKEGFNLVYLFDGYKSRTLGVGVVQGLASRKSSPVSKMMCNMLLFSDLGMIDFRAHDLSSRYVPNRHAF